MKLWKSTVVLERRTKPFFNLIEVKHHYRLQIFKKLIKPIIIKKIDPQRWMKMPFKPH